MSPKTAAEDNTGFKKNITASPSGKYSVIYHLQNWWESNCNCFNFYFCSRQVENHAQMPPKQVSVEST